MMECLNRRLFVLTRTVLVSCMVALGLSLIEASPGRAADDRLPPATGVLVAADGPVGVVRLRRAARCRSDRYGGACKGRWRCDGDACPGASGRWLASAGLAGFWLELAADDGICIVNDFVWRRGEYAYRCPGMTAEGRLVVVGR